MNVVQSKLFSSWFDNPVWFETIFALGDNDSLSLLIIFANRIRHGAKAFWTALQVFCLHIMLVSSTYTLGGALGKEVCNSWLDLYNTDFVMGHDCLHPASIL